MRQANYIRSNHPANGNMGFSLRAAWWFESLRDAMNNGFVQFTYTKKDGSTRTALGTRSPLLVPADKAPKGNSDNGDEAWNDSVKSIPYFDLEKNEWRSFNVLNFNSLDRVWKFNEPGTSSRQTGGVASAEKG